MKKVLTVVGGLVVGAVVIGVAVVVITYFTSKKLVCEANEGNITIMYNDTTIKGYKAKGMSYNLDEQKKYAEQIGVEAYLTEFETWFNNNTTNGSCTRK